MTILRVRKLWVLFSKNIFHTGLGNFKKLVLIKILFHYSHVTGIEPTCSKSQKAESNLEK